VALPPAEIVPTPPRHIYAAGKSYGATVLETRPELPGELAEEMMHAASILHTRLGLHAFSRIDFRLANGRPHVLDINSMPNIDPSSSYLPDIAAAHGVGLGDLLERILRFSLATGPRRISL
jgi:D-alanine-D-alanine ligase